ncbi:putative Primase C terminal 2 family protein [Thiocapsa sp. KS1]|jgi:hypothetical protein|nr:PriCT-2 domain-containing protein [Thiocapsa sp. KS1]CRI63938.1 putative Primase C terminal 2 family protein [Thiocapsa sp. KS1]
MDFFDFGPNSDGTTNYRTAAFAWYGFGLSVIPIIPGTKKTAVKWDEWHEKRSPASIDEYWSKHPDHEVGFIVGDEIIVFDADSPEAIAELCQLEEAFDLTPDLVVTTKKGEHHYFRRAAGTYAKSDSHSTEDHPERIDVKTGRAMVVLPPSPGKEIRYREVDEADELSEVGQDFIDAVFGHNGRQPPRRAPDVPEVTVSEGDVGQNARKCELLLAHVDPDDGGYDAWLHTGMAIYHETGGSEEGCLLWNRWSARGAKYKGLTEIRAKWASFANYSGTPITIATICKLLADRGIDWQQVLAADEEPFEIIEDAVVEIEAPHPLRSFSITGQHKQLVENMKEEVYVMDGLALRGQYSLLYAAPNTGKTLITLKLLSQSIEAGRVDPGDAFYVNMDDNYRGLMDKLAFAERYGFHMLAPGFQDFSESALKRAIIELSETGRAQGVVIVLDTLKKFVNLMDKNDSAGFNRWMRQFVLGGGTVIALAHVNKKRSADGKLVHAGTSDMMEDADCAYILDVVEDDAVQQRRTVEFVNTKCRGNVVDRAAYRYCTVRRQTYEALLDSVVLVGEGDLETVRQAEKMRVDQPVVDAVMSCIAGGHTKKMELVKEAALMSNVSQRDVQAVLDIYTGTDPAAARWTCTVGQRGAKIYTLLAHTSETSA